MLRHAWLLGLLAAGCDVAAPDPEERPDLAGAAVDDPSSGPSDLAGADLKGADLKGADLKGLDLNAAADLSAPPDLKGADLNGAPDLKPPPDLNSAADLKPPPDLNGAADLQPLPDLKPPADLKPPISDLAASPSDLAGSNEWVTAHNQVRATAMPTPSPALPALSWNTSAATVAGNWAAQCQYMHNAGRGNLGENIAAATGGSNTPTSITQLWASEAANYNYAANTCAAGKTCGHYTQVVWRTTTSLGCAMQTCTINCPFTSCVGGMWTFWVCDYAPPGNSGGRPY
jgi:pathogenesis-related protein 1